MRMAYPFFRLLSGSMLFLLIDSMSILKFPASMAASTPPPQKNDERWVTISASTEFNGRLGLAMLSTRFCVTAWRRSWIACSTIAATTRLAPCSHTSFRTARHLRQTCRHLWRLQPPAWEPHSHPSRRQTYQWLRCTPSACLSEQPEGHSLFRFYP